MKKITFLLLLFLLTGMFSKAQENFEGGIPSGWTVYNNAFGNNLWTTISAVTTPPTVCEGTVSAYVNGRENIGIGNTSEKWLVSNQVTVPLNGQLLFSTRSTINGFDNTTYQIRVSTVSQNSGFQMVAQWTEEELNQVFNICEDKTVDLGLAGYAGQDIYIAFVMVVTQPTATPTGDRWIVDDIRLVERCIEPTDILVGGISLEGATISWENPGGASQFEVEIVEFPNTATGSGELVTGTTFNATGLSESTQYQAYVRAVCDESNSEWVGPVNFLTTSPGQTCNAPIQIASLPYSTTDNTSTYGDDVSGSPGNGCGSTNGYLDGDDVFYTFTAQNNGVVNITMNPTGTWSGLFVYNSCANVGVSCIAGVANSDQTPRVIDLPVTAGQTYYIVISTWASPQSVAYTLTLQVVNCQPPASLSADNIGQTSAELSWSNPSGATSWEVAVQPAGSPIPSGSGETVDTNSNFLADGLTEATAYQYYVRADCGDGTFSAWSGPFLFNTTICEASEQCDYIFRLTDQFIDWEGAIMQVRQNGIVVATLSLDGDDGPLDVIVPLCNGLPFDLFWITAGSFPGEVRVEIINDSNQSVYNMNTSSAGLAGSVLYTDSLVECGVPECLPPTGLVTVAGTISDSSAEVQWAEVSGITEYEVIWLPSPSTQPSASDTGTLTEDNPFLITGLETATIYDVYVRAICATGTGNWSTALTFNTTICPVENQCNYTFKLSDQFDSWNGASMQVRQNGIVVATLTMPTTSDVDIVVPLCDNLPFDLFWNNAGFFSNEVEIEIIDPFDESLYILEDGSGNLAGTVIYNGFVSCTPPTCPKPNTLAASDLTQTGATLTWNEIGTATSWEVIILPAGSAAPLPTDTGDIVDVPTFTISDLDPGTSYVFYVRAICAEDDLSNWSGPRAFVTVIVNDECDNAILVPVNPDTNCGQVVGGTVIGATGSSQPNDCEFSGTADDDVWFEFVAVTANHSIDLLNVVGSSTDLYHIVYEGDECGNLTQLVCSDNNQSIVTGLTPGQTYKIRVYTWFSGAQTTTFDVCIGTIPPPISTSTTQYTVEELVQDILLDSTCATVSNITYSTGTNFGSTNGIGYFNKNNSSFQFEEGIILTTGNADRAPGPNVQFDILSDGGDATDTWVGDTDLDAVLAGQGISDFTLSNATLLEFDFIPLDPNFSFNFIFASEEYGTYQCQYSDVFAFLLTDLTTGITTNLAVVPDTNIPVSVTTIKNQLHNDDCVSENEEYFGQYYGDPNGLPNLSAPTAFNGLTLPLTASAIVVPGTQYHIKLAIADFSPSDFFGDGSYDSAVFIQGGSFNIGNVNLGDDFLVASGNAICPGDDQLLDTGLSPDNYSFAWSNQDGIIEGETGPSYLVTAPGTYTVEIQLLNSECTGSDTIVIEFFEDFVTGEPNDLYFCSASGFGTFDLTENDEPLTATLGDNYIIGYYLTEADATLNQNIIANPTAFNNTVNPQTIYVRVSPAVGDCFALNNFQLIVEDLTPQFTITPDFSICDGTSGTIEITPINYESGSVTYTWTLDTNPLPDTTSSISVTEAGIYQVTVDFGGCTNTASTTVAVISIENSVPTFDPVTACQDSEVTLPTTSLNGVVGLWSGTGITPEGVVDTSVAGEFTFTFTPDAELFECAIPVDFTVTITATVVATFEPITTTYCVGVTPDALPLSNNSVSGTWSPSAIDTSVASGDEPFVYTFTPDAECNAVTTVLITVNAPTDPKFDTLPLTYCEGDQVSALPLFSDEGISGSWDIGTIDTSAPAVDVRYTFTPDFGQCASDFFIDVTITAKAPTTFNPVNPICVGEALTLPTTSVEGTLGTWSGAGITPEGLVDTSVANSALVVTFTPTGCAEEQTVTIQIVARPAVDPGVDQIVCAANGTLILEPLINGVYYSGPNGTGNVLTQVEVSNTPQTVYIFAAGTLAGCSSESSFTVTFITVEADELSDVEECGRYILPEIALGNAYYTGPGATGTQLQAGQAIEEDQTIYIYASTGEGCFDQTSFEVVINNCDIQKGISPNGDGLNDFFDLTAYDVQKLSIYNRYGSKVYDRGNYSNEWYGQSSGGDELPDGTYYFVIEFNNIEAKSGWIYINRER